jgi:hypothetical protein
VPGAPRITLPLDYIHTLYTCTSKDVLQSGGLARGPVQDMTGEGRGEARGGRRISQHQSIRASEHQSIRASGLTASQRHHSPRDFFIVLYDFFFLLIN